MSVLLITNKTHLNIKYKLNFHLKIQMFILNKIQNML